MRMCRAANLEAGQAALLELTADVWLSCHYEARLVEAQDDEEISSLPAKRAKVRLDASAGLTLHRRQWLLAVYRVKRLPDSDV